MGAPRGGCLTDKAAGELLVESPDDLAQALETEHAHLDPPVRVDALDEWPHRVLALYSRFPLNAGDEPGRGLPPLRQLQR